MNLKLILLMVPLLTNSCVIYGPINLQKISSPSCANTTIHESCL